jgi:ribonuclease J
LRDDARVVEVLTKAVRQVAMEEIGNKPEVTVVIRRLTAE